MSKATKRKHVLNEIAQDYFTPPSEHQEIVKILSSRGNNLHEVEAADKDKFLVSMPTKFRKNIWVKRGDFVIVEPILEGDKVKAEMVRVLSKEHIKYFKKIKVWPASFEVYIGEARHSRHNNDDTSSTSSEDTSDFSSNTDDCDSDVVDDDDDEKDDVEVVADNAETIGVLNVSKESRDTSGNSSMSNASNIAKDQTQFDIDKLKIVQQNGESM